MSITLDYRETDRRVVITVATACEGSCFTDHVVAAVRARPEIAGWDWISDARGQVRNTSPSDVARLVEVLDGAEHLAHSVVVTGHRASEAWVQILNSRFRARRHWLVPSLPAAIRLLDALAAGASDEGPSLRSTLSTRLIRPQPFDELARRHGDSRGLDPGLE